MLGPISVQVREKLAAVVERSAMTGRPPDGLMSALFQRSTSARIGITAATKSQLAGELAAGQAPRARSILLGKCS